MDTVNKYCKFYPCHDKDKLESCTFCYCPLYPCNKGRGQWVKNDFSDEPILDCTNCTWPHEKERVDKLFEFLKDFWK